MQLTLVVVVLVLVVLVDQNAQCKPRGGGGKKWTINPGLQRSSDPSGRIINPSLLRSPSTRGMTRVDRSFARASWNAFNKGVSINERKDREKKKKAMRQLRNGGFFKGGMIGPPGPRGPAGPRGPKGANVTKEELFEEFRTMVNELTQRKILVGADPRCTELCVKNLSANSTGPVLPASLFGDEQDILVPKVVSSFMWELIETTNVPKNSRIELEMFRASTRPGAYGRETGSSTASTGRFVAPRTGFYSFLARMHLKFPRKDQPTPENDLFSVCICIDGMCRDKMSLESMSGFGPGDSIMTVAVEGMLHLKINDYVSLILDNVSDCALEVLYGSQFSGYLIGV